MTFHLIDINNIDSFIFDNIMISKKIELNENKSKYYIYYNSDDSPKEIYIRVPSVRLLYALSNHKYNQITIPLTPIYDKLNRMIKFIKKLENHIFGQLKETDTELEFNRIINKKNSFHFIKTNIDDNKVKITSNLNGKITLADFKINAEIEMVIKLDYIWNKNNLYGLSSNLYQIKYLGIPAQLNIDFIDFDIESKIEPKPVKIYESLTDSPTNDLPKLPQQIFQINPKDLLSTINKLKPIKK